MKLTLKRLTAAAAAGIMIISSSAAAFAAESSALSVMGAPSGIVQASDGSLLVTDVLNNAVWTIKDGKSTKLAGKEGVLDLYGSPVGGYSDGANAEAFFKEPWAITPFMNGYAVSDTENNVIRYVTADKTQTLCGSLQAGLNNATGTRAKFNMPKGLATGSTGLLYIADSGNNCIRTLNTNGKTETLVTGINSPSGLYCTGGVLYVCESGSNRIISIKDGKVTVIAGSGTAGYKDGAASDAQFNNPQGITVATDGAIYVSDTGNLAVRKIKDGQVTTLMKSDPSSMSLYPQEPRGLLAVGDKLYVCDAFSRKLLIINR